MIQLVLPKRDHKCYNKNMFKAQQKWFPKPERVSKLLASKRFYINVSRYFSFLSLSCYVLFAFCKIQKTRKRKRKQQRKSNERHLRTLGFNKVLGEFILALKNEGMFTKIKFNFFGLSYCLVYCHLIAFLRSSLTKLSASCFQLKTI